MITEITIGDMLIIGSVLLLYWILWDVYRELKIANRRIKMTDEQAGSAAVPEMTHEKVNLNFFVPQVESWEDLNKLLAKIGAIVVLTEDKVLEDVGHDPHFWRQLTEEEKEEYVSE